MPPNILLVTSDEHDPAVTGCYNHPYVETPVLDRLASQGTVFDNAYTNCPICVPARMSLMTGQYVHKINAWDNGSPLSSTIPTFGSYLAAGGYDTVLCGRTHFVGPDRLHGFDRRLLDDAESWQHSSMSAPNRAADSRRGSNSHVTECGPGDNWQNGYDQMATDLAVRFLESQSRSRSDRPWLLYTGYINPHFPLICPPELYNRYYPDKVLLPETRNEPAESQHPSIQQLRYWLRNEKPLGDDLSRKATASYYGLVSFTDNLVGQLLEVVDNTSLKDNTVVIYLSDHGEMAGHHGIWQKQCFFEHAARIPLICRVPGLPEGLRISQGASLVDILPTLLDLAGQAPVESLPGTSLIPAIKNGRTSDRSIFSEYHALGSTHAGYMIRKGDWKYIYYVEQPPQLFNVVEDPEEIADRMDDPSLQQVRNDLHAELLQVVDPEAVDRQAKENQQLKGIRRAYTS